MINQIVIPKPKNNHGHLRQGLMLGDLVRMAFKMFSAYLAMPNLLPAILTLEEALKYLQEIYSHIPVEEHEKFIVLVSIKLTEASSPEGTLKALEHGILDFKVYPKGRTTNAHDGVINFAALWPTFKVLDDFARMSPKKVRVRFHPTHPRLEWDDRDAEYGFLGIFEMIRQAFPHIYMIWEHLSDGRCIPHIKAMGENVGATVTAHHPTRNETQVFGDVHGGVCQPPFRTERDRRDVCLYMASGDDHVYAGLDDAPHDVSKKLVRCGRAACGLYTTEFGILLYAMAFDELGIFDLPDGVERFTKFTSGNMERLCDLPQSKETITLVREPFTIPEEYKMGDTTIIPAMAGETLPWSIAA